MVYLNDSINAIKNQDRINSDRTFSLFRKRCLTCETESGIDLTHDCVKELSEAMAAIMNINGRIKRMDFLMVASNIRKLGRMELLYTCVSDQENPQIPLKSETAKGLNYSIHIEVAVVEISKDEGAYVQPIIINKDVLYYFTFDDIMKLSYWLGKFWFGIQYQMNHRPEEIREVEQRESISGNSENYRSDKRIVLVRKIIPVDSEGNVIEYSKKGSGRQYKVPS